VLEAFLEGRVDGDVLVLTGEPGLGKTTLWEETVERAANEGHLVLGSRATEADARLPFAALIDLVTALEASYPEAVAGLPEPQRVALEVALRRRDSLTPAPDTLALGTALLTLIRACGERPVLLALDDVHWLDPSSSDCLVHLVRRLPATVSTLIARRPGPASALERAAGSDRIHRLDLVPMADRDMRALLSPLHAAAGVVDRALESAEGNPLFALELTRLLAASGALPVARMPLPDSAADVFSPRVAALAPEYRECLLAVAIAGGLSREELEAAVAPELIVAATDRGLLREELRRIRVVHPLLAAAARDAASPAEMRAAHLLLAGCLNDPVVALKHRALATDGEDGVLAAELASAATTSRERGATEDARDLGEAALRLTPADDPALSERTLELARLRLITGDHTVMLDQLREALPRLAGASDRAHAQLLIAEASPVPDDLAHIALALQESDADEIKAIALSRESVLRTVGNASNRAEWGEMARAAYDAALRVGDVTSERRAIATLAWIDVLAGRPVDVPSPTCADVHYYDDMVERPEAVRLAARGHVVDAEEVFVKLRRTATELGQSLSMLVFAGHLFELACRRGDVASARDWVREFNGLPGAEEVARVGRRFLAELAATSGHAATAIRLATATLDDPHIEGWDDLAARRTLGMGHLRAGEYEEAAEHLAAVWDHCVVEGIDEPGIFPVAGDLVEAMTLRGQLDEASAVIDRLASLALAQDHPWACITVDRCRALVALATSYDDEQAGVLEKCVARYRELGLDFDAARTLLACGLRQRRADRRTAARATLRTAAGLFGELGCTGWAEAAAKEAAAISGRRNHEGKLTPSQLRVAELAAAGRSNQQIAQELVLSVHTVETHLSQAYARLGIRSRAQLIHHLADSRDQ